MRVVITGMGAVSPLGIGVSALWEGITAGRSGISPIKLYPLRDYDCKIAGQIPDFNPLTWISERELRITDRFTQVGLAAALEAWQDAGLNENSLDRSRVGVYVGTGIGGIGTYEETYDKIGDKPFIEAFTVPRIMNNAPGSWIAIKLGIRGPNLTFNTACSSGANAIGQAFRSVRSGEIQAAICGGAEAPIAPKFMRTWNSMKVLSKKYDDPSRASRPFDKTRDGFVMSEGGAMLIIESLDSATARGARIHAEILGFGSTCDAHSLTAPQVEGQATAMMGALKDGGLSPDAVGYVNAHGTGTVVNDRVETSAIKEVFGARAMGVPVSSTKSMLGHAMGASPALEMVITALTVRESILPPTINFEQIDPECDLDYVPNQARRAPVEVALCNSFGFGGSNAVIVVKRWEP